MDLSRELSIALELARHAGQTALDLQHNLTVANKPAGEGPVTNADIAIDEYIVKRLAHEFPSDLIISEESYVFDQNPLGNDRIWFVDPIDGTASYLTGADDFVIMIGLAIGGIARLGVVYQPASDRLWNGIFSDSSTGTFAQKIEKGLTTVVTCEPLPKSSTMLTVIASRTHKSRRQDAMINALHPKQIRYQSSIGLKAMLILEHYADFYVAWSRQIKKWDTCAPCAIINAAGANISFIDGKKLSYLGPISHDKPIMIANFTPDEDLLETLWNIGQVKL